MPTTPVPPRTRRGPLVLAALAVLLVVGAVTLGPPGAVADARRAVTAVVEALAAPWPGTVQRAQVEAAANVLLFVPVGALAAVVLRRHLLLALLAGAGTSVLVELAQTALPGRVPDLADVAANTAGTVVGVTLVGLCRVVRRRPRQAGVAALVAVPLLLAGCSPAARDAAVRPAPDGTTGALLVPEQTPLARVTDPAELTAEDGFVPDGTQLSPFDDVPAITRLDAALRAAVQEAHRQAAADGVDLHVTTGWRSAAYQQVLFDDAVREYGSPEAARAHVLRPDESAHVTGDAVDVGPTDAMYWLSRFGSDVGLCQTYANEAWHFELGVEPGGECPPPAADPRAG